MKRMIVTLAVVLAAVSLAILLGAPKGQTYPSSAALAAPTPAPMVVPMPARCPNIHEALERLRSAEHELREGGHDFCGHKVEAMEAVHRAIEQLRAAEDCAKCREGGEHREH